MVFGSLLQSARKFAGMLGSKLEEGTKRFGEFVEKAKEKVKSVPILGKLAGSLAEKYGLGDIYSSAMDIAGGTAQALKGLGYGADVEQVGRRIGQLAQGRPDYQKLMREASAEGARRQARFFQRGGEA